MAEIFIDTELIFTDKSVWAPYIESDYTRGAQGFCVAKVMLDYTHWVRVFMPIYRWREIRTHQSYVSSGFNDVMEMGFCYLGDIIERWD